MSGMGKVFELLNRLNGLKVPNQGSEFTRDSGMNAKVKMGENVVVKLG
jgi:hypothetical protein|tara:strand:- start:4010 stop:4153 length:144 start_codon:yes stop_codon:yes gene_type:complete